MDFSLVSQYLPRGDQPAAIQGISDGFAAGKRQQLLLGATGTGKTFTVANVVAHLNRPTLVLAHNKTLAAQLYGEFKQLFPRNAVEYFVSYYDYYQPEAYVPSTDTFIEKDALINDEIDRMRHSATRSLLERDDVLVVASVSCIYGIGAAEVYKGMTLELRPGEDIDRDTVLRRLVELQYDRNDMDFARGTFRVRGDVVEVFPVYEEERALRLEWFGDELEAIREVDPLRGKVLRELQKIRMFPASHYVTPPDRRARAIRSIEAELREHLQVLEADNKLLERQRLEQRTQYDLEMLETVGMVKGIENYSRHLSGRAPGEPPPTLLDYFPDDYLLVVDESHQMMPQVGAMFRGDRARKSTLVDFGFRLPSAIDNRPLKIDEFEKRVDRVIYVSATPADYELDKTGGEIVEQIIRPTGLVDPIVEVRPAGHQVDELLEEVRKCVAKNERVLVTTLTKRMSEDLSEYYQDLGVKVRYLHADIDTMERADIIRELRMGTFDVLIGINLLREGLDIPEVALVAILDADKEGFLRGERSLIQTIGRAARNVNGRVIMFADKVTASMKAALDETERRRTKQLAYNLEHNITPQTVQKEIQDLREIAGFKTELKAEPESQTLEFEGERYEKESLPKLREHLRKEMKAAASELNFERAAELRDTIRMVEAAELGIAPASGGASASPRGRKEKPRGRRRGARKGHRP